MAAPRSTLVDDRVPRNAVFVRFCYYEAAANLLMNPVLDPFSKIPEFKCRSCEGCGRKGARVDRGDGKDA